MSRIGKSMGLPRWCSGKELAGNAECLGLMPVSGRSPGEGNGNPFQYSCLRSPMDRAIWWATVRGFAKGVNVTEHTHIHT